MKIVIVGDGKVGYTLTEQLAKEGHDIVVIDSSQQALQNSMNSLDVIGIRGNGAALEVQMEAGVNRADLLIAVTSSDELNLLCCIVAKKIGARHTIARVRNPEYTKQLVLMKEEFGMSMFINPEFLAALEISRILRFPSASKIDSFAKGRVDLVEIKINENSPLDGYPLHTLYEKYKVKVLVCAVQRGERVFIPDGNFVLRSGDRISITASPAEIESFFRAIGIVSHKVRSVLIVGGGRITYYLARQLLELGMKVKIIEIDRARCDKLCEMLPDADIIHGDGTSEELLLEEGVENTDAFVALTDMDEENIILSMYAASKSQGKIVAKINRISFLEIIENSGIESVISPKYLTANQIIRYVRALRNSLGSKVETLYRIVNNKAEALEFKVGERARVIGKTLTQLELKENLLIACIVRKGRIIIPRGSDQIEHGDSVIVVTTNSSLRDLDDILK
ncbi:Trk system potassium transporter TrkA [Feifania hominis]|uniref:Trk system potassium uptake protein TrkA n=1 Tax=Feifania hominis TaxID=2763660 RepID=A0A926DCA2_9FIRM|nr:Trk system potassium transporter TrkA [Feifania hominis]MBC8535237.1 Trk system potassium transporter TrkA [Feifania hominis]